MSERDAQIAKYRDLVLSRQLRLGMSREDVRDRLGLPDDTGCVLRNGVPLIYKYGFIEIAFGRGMDGLLLVYADSPEDDFVKLLG